ncbi:protein of unknown function [Candidatus Nitrosotalea okcheonensis]|uniref:Uncharacterized protein n=1 Tax=Candidatus Nitrosotalea okcheonensis TaxID=1903276 RepID=A0A2H1FEX8_9ARCH|nr:protein of unknown function [Candidatus Nitrosotalea okcheonensis]
MLTTSLYLGNFRKQKYSAIDDGPDLASGEPRPHLWRNM